MFLLISGGGQTVHQYGVKRTRERYEKRFGKKLRNCGPQRPKTWTNCLYISLLYHSFSWLLPHRYRIYDQSRLLEVVTIPH